VDYQGHGWCWYDFDTLIVELEIRAPDKGLKGLTLVNQQIHGNTRKQMKVPLLLSYLAKVPAMMILEIMTII
jgi:hypothetical protein